MHDIQAETNVQHVTALWPTLPTCESSQVFPSHDRSSAWAPLAVRVLDQNLSFGIERAGAAMLPPCCSVSLSWKQAQGRLHIEGGWMDALCAKVGLSTSGAHNWPHVGLPLSEFMVRWLLSGLLSQIHTLSGEEAQVGNDASNSDTGPIVRLALRERSSNEVQRKPCIWLELPETLLKRLPRQVQDDRDAFWWRVPFQASLQAGYQVLQLDQLTSLACGDIVLLRQPLQGLHLVLTPGHQADVRSDERQGYVVANAWYFDERREVPMDYIPAPNDEAGDDRLDQLTAQLVCEVGRLSMTLSDLKALNVGSVLPMARTTGQAVDLIVNGLKIGQGELVRLDDTLGVRVTRLAQSHG